VSEFDSIVKFIQSPLGRMLFNAGKDVVTNHIIPYMRDNASKPVNMSQEEQERRAQSEFVDVSGEFDIPGETSQKENKP
jgi:hypothetical protein